jgi:hypothetical protein
LLDTRPFPVVVGNYHAIAAVAVPADGPDATADVVLNPGRSVPLEVRHPGGKPRETYILGLAPPVFDRMKEFAPGTLRVGGLEPGRPRRVFAVTRDETLGGHTDLSGKETEPAAVTLKPVGTVTGRVVDAAGKPLAGQGFQLYYDDGTGGNGVYLSWGFWYHLPSEAEAKRRNRTGGVYEDRFGRFSLAEQTDPDGRFRIARLIPDVPFDLWVVRIDPQLDPKSKELRRLIVGRVKAARVTVKPGEVKDVGDLKLEK